MFNLKNGVVLFTRYLDTISWVVFLALMVWASFIQSAYGSSEWFLFTFIIYGLCVLACVKMLCLDQRVPDILKNQYLPLLVISISLLYLLVQSVLPYESALTNIFTQGAQQGVLPPSWFAPNFRLSVVPNLTMTLFWSETIMLCTLLLVFVLVDSRKRFKQLLWILCLVCFFHALVGIVAKFSSVLLVDTLAVDGHFSAARAWFVNRNHFASFISISMVAALTYQLRVIIRYDGNNLLVFLIRQLLGWNALILLVLFVAFTAVVLSQSRAVFLSLIFAVIICSFLLGKNLSSSRSVLFLILFGVFIAVISLYFGEDLLSRLRFNGSIFGERIEQWGHTWNLIKQEWLLGYGGNSYATVYQATRGQDELRELIYNQAHNDYLHIWLEQGLFGLMMWIFFIYISFKAIWRGLKVTQSTLVTAFLIAAGIVISAALLQAMVGFNLHIVNIRFYFFVIIGLIFAAPRIRHRPKK